MLYEGPTPIESYSLKGITVGVKREDLAARPPAPPLAKVRGFNLLLESWAADGVSLVGAFEAGASSAGHAVAACVSQFPGMECIIGYVREIAAPLRPSVCAARELGAHMLPLRPNVLNVCYGQAKRHVEALGGRMIPFGFEFKEAVDSVAFEAAGVPRDLYDSGTVVVCCGSGVTLAGLSRGFTGQPNRIIGVSSGRSLSKIRGCLKRQGVLSASIQLIESAMPYRTACDAECPFPSDQYYDRKAWKFLVENAGACEQPILFWNVGG